MATCVLRTSCYLLETSCSFCGQMWPVVKAKFIDNIMPLSEVIIIEPLQLQFCLALGRWWQSRVIASSDRMEHWQGPCPISWSKWSSYKVNPGFSGLYLNWSQAIQGRRWRHLSELHFWAIFMGKRIFLLSTGILSFQLRVIVSSLLRCCTWYCIAPSILMFMTI